MADRRLRDRLGWGGLTVAGTGVVETAVRTVPEAVEWALDAGVGAVLASVVINLGLGGGLLPATQLAFLVTVFYRFAPDVMPGAAGERAATERPYRLLLALGSGAFALPVVLGVTGAWRTVGGTRWSFLAYVVAAVVVVGAVMALYLSATQARRLLHPDGRATDVVRSRDGFDPEVDRATLARVEGWSRPARWGFHALGAVATAASHVVPLVVLGVLGAALNAVFPVLEVVVLVGLLADAADGDGERGPSRWVPRNVPDVEAVFYDHLTLVTQGPTGAAAILACMVAVLVPVGGFVVLLSTGLFDPGSVGTSWRLAAGFVARWATGTVGATSALDQVVDAVVSTGELVALPVVSGYGAWFWYREIGRVPAAVSAVEAADAVETIYRGFPARPPGAMVPAAALALAWKVELVGGLGGVGSFYAPGPTRLAFAVGWPVPVVALAWSVRATRRRDRAGRPQAVTREGRPLFVALLATAFGGLLYVTSIRQAAVLATVGTALVAWLYYFETVAARTGEADRRWATVAYGFVPLVAATPAVLAGVGEPVLLLAGAVPLLMALGTVLADRLPDPDATGAAADDADAAGPSADEERT